MTRTHSPQRRPLRCFRIGRILLAAILLSVGPTGAVRAADAAEKILSRCAKAMGGEKALRKVTSWQSRGTATRVGDGRPGNFEAAARLPGQFWQEVRIEADVYAEAFNGKSGWRTDPGAGLRTLTGEAGRDFQAEARFRCVRWLDWKKDKCRLADAGAATLNGRAVRKVLLVTRRDTRITLYFDAGSGLLAARNSPPGTACTGTSTPTTGRSRTCGSPSPSPSRTAGTRSGSPWRPSGSTRPPRPAGSISRRRRTGLSPTYRPC